MIYDEIISSIAEGEAEVTLELTKQALAQGYPTQYVLEKGLIIGMCNVADKFKVKKVMIPEVLMAAEAMKAGLSVIQPYLKIPKKKTMGKIVLGTVEGDIHDIGTSLVNLMIISTGARVIDLGVDVTPKQFAGAVRKEKADILMMSALLTTTMTVMKDVILELENQRIRKDVKVIVGGAPINRAFAREIGADYYFESAFKLRSFLVENLSKIITSKAGK